MSIQSRIETTGHEIGQQVFAARSSSSPRRNPLQPDLYSLDTPFVFGRVTGFMVFSNMVLVTVQVDGETDAHPYPVGVWRNVPAS
jgi:hypothetical protein